MFLKKFNSSCDNHMADLHKKASEMNMNIT